METTLTTEISAVQLKLAYLQFKSLLINKNIGLSKNEGEKESQQDPSYFIKTGEIVYHIIDVIALFENYNTLSDYILNSKSFSNYLRQEKYRSVKDNLKEVRKTTQNWKFVRNKIGGHLDMDAIINLCENYNFKGVMISNNLEADFKGVGLRMMLESAINSTLDKSKLFESNLNLMNSDMEKFILKFNSDWLICLQLFESLWKFLYEIGKEEKLSSITEKDIGIIKF